MCNFRAWRGRAQHVRVHAVVPCNLRGHAVVAVFVLRAITSTAFYSARACAVGVRTRTFTRDRVRICLKRVVCGCALERSVGVGFVVAGGFGSIVGVE